MLRPINLAGVDLNLLVAFEALLEEQNVSRAASKVGLSQPSMSHALKRLRELFHDDLFRRGPTGMEPTPRALELSAEIIPGLAKLRGALNQQVRFDPATAERLFTLGLSDIGSFHLLPLLMPALRAQAPMVQISVVDLEPREAAHRLQLGEIDLATNAFAELPANLLSRPLFSFPIVCVLDRRNPRLKRGRLDVDAFLELPHVSSGQVSGKGIPTDFELNALGLRRRIALHVPHFLAIPGAVLGTDMIAVFDAHTAQAFAGWPDLAIVPAPLPISPVAAQIVWHPRSNEDAGHTWLRNLVMSTHAHRLDRKPDDKAAARPAGGGRTLRQPNYHRPGQ